MKMDRGWDVFAYVATALLAVALLVGVTAIPGNPAELFPNPSPQELMQGVQWAWGKAF
jgi:hypothetical protein